MLVVVNGVFGYSLPDDLLSGTGLRIAYSITQSMPLIGPNLASLLFGGDFPTTGLIARIYPVHILLVPARHRRPARRPPGPAVDPAPHAVPAAAGAATAPSSARRWCRPTRCARPASCSCSPGCSPPWAASCRSTRSGSTVPTSPWDSTSFAQPDWYTGWLEGAVRMMPAWDIHIGGLPAARPVLAGRGAARHRRRLPVRLALARRGSSLRDDDFHNVLQTPRDRPGRTAIGAGLLTFLVHAAAGRRRRRVRAGLPLEPADAARGDAGPDARPAVRRRAARLRDLPPPAPTAAERGRRRELGRRRPARRRCARAATRLRGWPRAAPCLARAAKPRIVALFALTVLVASLLAGPVEPAADRGHRGRGGAHGRPAPPCSTTASNASSTPA